MKVGIDMKGLDKAVKELKQAGLMADEAIEDVLTDTAIEAHALAVMGVQNGPASGRTYEKYNPRRTHRASAPGEYPMSDTGGFAGSIHFELDDKGARFEARVGTADMRGLWFEYGTSKMAARPWLARSITKASQGIAAELMARLK